MAYPEERVNAYDALATVYDSLMFDCDYDAWAKYLLRFLKGRQNVLETACGTGGLTVRLAKAGLNIVATDLCENMLNICAASLLKAGAKAKTVKMDMRRLQAASPFDAVVCACDGVNYLSLFDLKKFFEGAYRCLKENGVLLFDISSEYKYREVIGTNVFCDETEQSAYIWKNSISKDRCEMDISLYLKEGEAFKRVSERHTHYIHRENELLALLKKCGFEATSFDFLTLEHTKEQSQRIQFEALRK